MEQALSIPVYLLIPPLTVYLSMSCQSATNVQSVPAINGTKEKPALKPCCACLETKEVRDACIIEKGEEKCTDLIEAHKECMRALGFKI